MVSLRRIVANDIKRMALKIVAPMIAKYLTEDMDVDVDDALRLLLPYIRKRGIRVDERGEEYLRRQVGKFMELLKG